MNENQDALFEPNGDAYVVSAEPPKRKRTGLLIGLGCLLLALLAAGGWWLLNHLHRDPLKDLKAAAKLTWNCQMDLTKDLPNLHKANENLDKFLASDDKHMELSFKVEGVMRGAEEIPDVSAQFSVDRDGSASKTLMHGSVTADGMDVPFDLYMDKNELQIGSSKLLNAGEVLAIPLKDFGKKWNESPLAASASEKLPEDLSLSFLAEGLTEKSMKAAFGSDWSKFMDSVSYRKATEADGKSVFTGTGELYVLSYDQELLTKMGKEAESVLNSLKEDPQMDKLLPAVAVGLLSKLAEETEAPKFLVSDGMLLGASIQHKGAQEFIRFELLGEDNPLSRYTLDELTLDPATQELKVTLSIEYTVTVADGQMRTKMVQTEAGSSEPTAVMEYVYNDADGSFSFSGTGGSSSFGFNDMTMTNAEFPNLTGSLLEGVTLREVPTEDGVHMEFSMDMGKILADYAYPVEGTMSYSIDYSPKTGSVQALSKEPTQLLELDQMSLGMLVMRIYNKISGGNAFNFN